MINYAYNASMLGRAVVDESKQTSADGPTEPEPLAPGQDPLTALSPEMRELVLSTDQVAPEEQVVSTGTKVQGFLAGGAVGALGAMIATNAVQDLFHPGARSYGTTGLLMAAGGCVGAIYGASHAGFMQPTSLPT